MIFRSRAFLSTVWLLLLAAGIHAQTGGESALTKLRSEFESTMAKSTIEPLRAHIADLLALERKAAAAADWRTAMDARDDRVRAEAELATVEKVGLLLETVAGVEATQGATILLPKDAKLEGVRWNTATDVLTDWLAPGSHAVWTLPSLPAGGYEVVLRYASSATQGGTIEVKEAFYSLKADTKITLRGVEEHNIGTLRIRSGTGTLTLTATSVSKGGLMDLAGLELRPVSD